jgi:V8-like Glu-specific endopeptidase
MVAMVCGGAGVAAAATDAAGASRAAGVEYWTHYRMEHAVPMGPTPTGADAGADAGAADAGGRTVARAGADETSVVVSGAADDRGVVARDTGKVFFELDGTDYVCSGAAVGGPRVSVVVTAAHCVTDGYGGWATHWVFVPGYTDGDEPYGSFPSQRFFVSPRWNAGMDETYDVAFVAVSGLTHGLPVGFDADPRSAYVFGYPADPPYNGGSMLYCAGPLSRDPGGDDSGIQCHMTAGDSGGPWLTGFQSASGTGTVVGVSAFKYSDNDQVLYGAVFGDVAQDLYQEALATAR